MKIDSISTNNASNKKRPLINAKTSGYTAAGGMGLAMASGMCKNKALRHTHKIFAGISLIATIAHICLVVKKPKKTQPTISA